MKTVCFGFAFTVSDQPAHVSKSTRWACLNSCQLVGCIARSSAHLCEMSSVTRLSEIGQQHGLCAQLTCHLLRALTFHHVVCLFLAKMCCMYRLCETYHSVSQLPLASPTFTHRLDPHWPLCTYDIRGSCRDAKCEFQHASDYQLENVAVLRDLHSQAVRSVFACCEAVACPLLCMHATV